MATYVVQYSGDIWVKSKPAFAIDLLLGLSLLSLWYYCINIGTIPILLLTVVALEHIPYPSPPLPFITGVRGITPGKKF
jgi:hypothetical protein